MKEVIVRLTSDHIKVKGGEYVRDLVRCKECKHRCTDDCPMCNECGRKAYPTSDDDFCSYGEREGE